MFKLSVEIAFEDPAIDGVILLGMHHTPGLQEDFVDKVAEVAKNYTKPIVACDIGETEMALFIRSRYDKLGIPSFTSPEDASRAMAALVEYGLYLKKTSCFEQYVNSFQQS
jgi:acyl-CoA synthetase (NDP forming)